MNNNARKIGILGTSGFSRETLDVCINAGYNKIVFIGDRPREREYFGYQLVDEEQIPSLNRKGFVFVIGIGDNAIRKKIVEKYENLHYVNLIHSSASFGDKQQNKITEKRGNIVTAGVRMTNNIQMGNFGIFNLNCTIGHDCVIEDFVNVAPGVNVSGNVKLSEGAYIGTNAAILQGKTISGKMIIGKFATVGAGAVVTKSVPDNVVVKGAPAKHIGNHAKKSKKG